MCMDCMTSGILFHHLAITTQGNLDAAVSRLREFVTSSTEAKTVAVVGFSLTATFMNSSRPLGYGRPLIAARARVPAPYEHLTDTAHWIARTLQVALDCADPLFEPVDDRVDTYVLTHDLEDCIYMAGIVLIHYYGMIVVNHEVTLRIDGQL